MDGLSVLGLVANVVQLVDAATSAFGICREIYTHGTAIEDSRLADTTNRLHERYDALEQSLNTFGNTSTSSRSGIDLKHLGSKCCETAKSLTSELESLRKAPGTGFHETLSKFVTKKRKATKIEKLKSRLDEYQKALDSVVLLDLRHVPIESLGNIETQQGQTDQNFGQQISQLATSLRSCHLSISDRLTVELDQATKRLDAEHSLTRQHAEQHINAAVQDLKTSQNEYRLDTEKQKRSNEAREQFLRSLAYDEINLRKNEISSSHPETFQWIFDENLQHPWDCFAEWLKSDNHIYWINGKAGSGKSTLMKFLANHEETESLLAQWSASDEVLVVTYYFWLSGSILQRSSKGFLCSVIYQMLSGDDGLFEKSRASNKQYLDKRVIHDWSKSELQGYLNSLLILISRPICFFIDGLDEFDHKEDIDYLLSLVSKFAAHTNIKICTSSRPEPFILKRMAGTQQLRLQDLTAKDMETCVRSELQRLCSQSSPLILRERDVDKIIRAMTVKADGVFLWVFYTLSSLSKGLRNEDDYHELLQRVEELPGEMHQLYLQMWQRLNGDEKHYRAEAATYFSYKSFYPLTLFDMVVALDPALQEKYLDECRPQDPLTIADRCARLQTRILTRCAGLLEVNLQPHGDTDPGPGAQAYNNTDQGILLKKNARIEFLHRTARDFLVDTKEGQALFTRSKETQETLERNIFNARLASAIEGEVVDKGLFMSRIFRTVHRLGIKTETSTLIKARKVCESVMQPGEFAIYYRPGKTLRGFCDFEGLAAAFDLERYVHHFVMSFYSQISPYYLGYLVLCSMSLYKREVNLRLVAWLVREGADLGTRHIVQRNDGRYGTAIPALELCRTIMNSDLGKERGELHDPSGSENKVQILRELTSSLLRSRITCLVGFIYQGSWLPTGLSYNPWFFDSHCHLLWVEMSIAKLCVYMMLLVEKRTLLPMEWEHNLTRFSEPALLKMNVPMITFALPQHSQIPRSRHGVVLEDNDSQSLGHLLNHALFGHVDDEAIQEKEIMDRIQELNERYKHQDGESFDKWLLDIGWRFPSKTPIFPLDPFENVTEDDWMEKGYFREHEIRPLSQQLAQSRVTDAESE